jgi:hypothetical protein
MIQNERQHKITRSKLRDLQLDRATLDLPADLHPRQVLARQNSLGILIGELETDDRKPPTSFEKSGVSLVS